jgi:hypothetical protein
MRAWQSFKHLFLALQRRERMKVREVVLPRALTPTLSHVVGEGVRRALGSRVLQQLLLGVWMILPVTSISADLQPLIVLSYPDRPAKLPLGSRRMRDYFISTD